ncbi:lipase [Oceanobacillus piezotolerans]|uniref:Lipase n=1 Tax=Oceanobacillus piezotolerans TaxID=2448030 RepID=A0A498DBV5_9BACI|nr:alpha/beta fold hydrolase [Oceanobacillus piezotolerans]RLL47048.1 lipase [Oceanobacillus piezotolerans]
MKEKYPIMKGAEPFYFKRSDIGILISHGFMGTPQSIRFIGEGLAKYGYSILAPRLKGHGTHYLDLEKCTYKDWFQSLEKGYQELKQYCTSIFVFGQSMGGTLAFWLSHKYPEIKGIISINAALTIPAYEHLRGKTTPRFLDEGDPDIKAKGVYEITYSKNTIHAIQELQTLMDQTPAILPTIQCPVLGFKSILDHVVPPENTDTILKTISSDIKKRIILKNSYHVASMDYDKEQIVKECHRFVQRHVSQVTAGG